MGYETINFESSLSQTVIDGRYRKFNVVVQHGIIAMKHFYLAGAVFASLLLGTMSQADVVVYEGFDYTAGSAVVGLNGGTGFGGSWNGVTAGGAGTANVVIDAGFGFGDLEVSGGSLARNDRNGRGVVHRQLSAAAIADLTADNSTIWFSVLMDPTINTSGTGGQFGNTYATLVFGNENLTDSSTGAQAGAGTDIANSGNGFGVGFFGGPTSFADGGIQGVSFLDGAISQDDGATNSIVTGDSLSLIVGRIDWAADGSDDTLQLFDITNLSDPLPTAFATLAIDVDQSDFDTISIADGQTSGFDEIRFGTTLSSVIPTAVPEPGSLAITVLFGVGLIARRRR